MTMIPIQQIENETKDLPRYRKEQIYRAIFAHAYESWDNATDLPGELRERLTRAVPLAIDSELFTSANSRTVKALTRLDDGNHTETVLMRSKDRNTVCVSSQVGCAMGCAFCLSGKNGLTRNLSFAEIVSQVLLFSRLLKTEGAKVTNVVFMGIGEPLLNYDSVIEAIRFLNRKDTLNIGARRFSISTCGITPGIKKLAYEDGLDVNLAVSLHSAIDEKRAKLMRAGNRSSTTALARNLKEYFEKTKRKIMIEYVLLKDLNTQREDALELRNFINATKAAYVVNLIPLNATSSGLEPPSRQEIEEFKKYLGDHHINFIQRFAYGHDIDAACGQLAAVRDA